MIKKRMICVIVLFVISLSWAQASDYTPFVKKAATIKTLKQLQAGGLVLYMRHGPTDTSRPDRVPRVDLNDCSTQRPLTEAGRAEAAAVGQALRQADIPIGTVLASPMCRARESAIAAFAEDPEINHDLMYTSNLTSQEKVPKIKTLRRLLSTPVAAGTNLVLVAHAPNLMDVMGYFVKPEATVVVFRPLGKQGFEYLGSIEPQQWQGLLDKLGE
ncbi:histidine phosphatase family protein [bacterium]|nr:histidine phosphatase family protein [bacterium]